MAKTTELGKFISTQRTYPSGDIVGYRVRSPKSGVEQYFGIKTFGTLDKALADLLLSWYQSGYQAGRYHALREVNGGTNNNMNGGTNNNMNGSYHQ